jgi:hypothetical protein
MFTRAVLLSSCLLVASTACAQTPVEIQPVKQLVRTGALATCGYTPTTTEGAFFGRLDKDGQVTGSDFGKSFRIQGKKGKYVSWYGIVRGISPGTPDAGKYTLLLEQKFFDGMTDCHIMLVSERGSGDFQATLEGSADSIPALALVRVYGKVVTEDSNVPQIAVEFMRVWPWLSFTFTDLGPEDHGNPRWAEYCTLCKSGGRIYNPYPTGDYYRAVLGDPEDFGIHLQQVK